MGETNDDLDGLSYKYLDNFGLLLINFERSLSEKDFCVLLERMDVIIHEKIDKLDTAKLQN